jgi:phage shock protein PspC (stress-responsive transcriptional regulator)
VFDRYGCNKFCLRLFGVLSLIVTAVIVSVYVYLEYCVSPLRL